MLILTEPDDGPTGRDAMEAVRRECPSGTIEPLEPRLVGLVRQCQARTPATGDSHPVRLLPILKFGAVRLLHFDFIVYADTDVALLPEADLASTAARWALMAPSVRNHSWPELLSNADSMSPVNGGLFIVRPRRQRYESGLRVLRRCVFNETHGWDHVGTPRSLRIPFRFVDGERMPAAGGDTGDPPLASDAYRRDNWGFVGADSDQGFLFYVYHVLGRAGAYVRWAANRHRALHWRGDPKPWTIALDAPRGGAAIGDDTHPWFLARAYAYLGYSMSSLLGGADAEASPCARALYRFRRAIEDDPRFYALPEPGLVTMVPYVPTW